MKNKLIKIFLISFIVLLTLISFCKIIEVKADSGWDTSYDSGGSWDSGSSWGSSWDSGSSSDHSYHSNYYGNSSSSFDIPISYYLVLLGAVIFVKVIIPSLVDLLYAMRRERRKKIGYYNIPDRQNYAVLLSNRLSEEDAKKIINDFDLQLFYKKAYQIFYDVQIGWMEFDYDYLKLLLSDELYNTYLMDLEALKTKKQKNVMENFEQIATQLIDLKEQNNKYIAKVLLETKFIDYIEDSNTHKVLRGSNTRKVDNTYILTFEKAKTEKIESICPNCGASVEGNATGICEYCKSKLINETHDWVLSKKEKISQK